MALNSILDPVLKPILTLPPFWGILIISLIIAVIMTFIYKWMTDQHLMKALKDDIKKFQKEMKLLRHDPQKMLSMQKKAMETNMKYMMHSMKPTIFTIIPIILIFGWLTSNIAYLPIMPEQEFTTTAMFAKEIVGSIEIVPPENFELKSNMTQEIIDNKASWTLIAPEEGEYTIEYIFSGKSYFKDIIITTKQKYAPVKETIKNSELKMITIDNPPLKVLNLFGWRIGWLGSYIIFSIVFSMLLRRWLKIH